MEWGTFNRSFCESKLFDSEEYFNALSSIFMLVAGLVCFYTEEKLRVLSILMVANCIVMGLGSFFFHLYNSYGWRLLDEIPMLFLIYYILINLEFLYKVNRYIELRIIAYTIAIFVLIIIDTIPSYSNLFPIYFGSLMFYVMYRLINHPIFLYRDRKILFNSLTVMFSGMVLWLITEELCENIYISIAVFGHPTWHFTSSYAVHNIIKILNKYSLYI